MAEQNHEYLSGMDVNTPIFYADMLPRLELLLLWDWSNIVDSEYSLNALQDHF